MAKTLLKVTQDILGLMDADEVNHISDSIESEQVARCVETIYNQIISEYDLPVKRTLFRLENTDDDTLGKTRLFLPPLVQTLDTLSYDARLSLTAPPNYRPIHLVSNEDFLHQTAGITPGDNTEEQVYYNSTFKFQIYTNRPPRYATLVEDKVLTFDAYDKNVDFTLQNSKTMCFGVRSTEMILEDEFVIDLPYELLTLLESNSAELAFGLYKGDTPDKITDLARKARVRQQRSKNKTRNRDRTGPDYGRKNPRTTKLGDEEGISTGTVNPLPDYLKS